MSWPCPKCGTRSADVVDSRAGGDGRGRYIRRRRRCVACTSRFTTYEIELTGRGELRIVPTTGGGIRLMSMVHDPNAERHRRLGFAVAMAMREALRDEPAAKEQP